MSNQAATFNKYSHSDVVAKFAAENLVATNDCIDYITVTKLYAFFKFWCKQNHYRNCSRNVFIKNMKTLQGISHERQREPKTWRTQNAVSMFRYAKLRETQA